MSSDGPVQRQLTAYNARELDAFLACYAEDVVVRHGDGRVLMTGREEMRSQYAALFEQNPDLHAEVVNRLQVGDWVVDDERVSAGGLQLQALVGYRLDGDVIRDVVMMTAEG